MFWVSPFIFAIADTADPPPSTALCEICSVQRGVGAQISRAATRGKYTSIDLLADADGLAMHTLRLKAVDVSGH